MPSPTMLKLWLLPRLWAWNWLKLPIFYAQGRITPESVRADLAMIPLLLIGAALGIWVLRKLPQKLFEKIILFLSALAALKLFF